MFGTKVEPVNIKSDDGSGTTAWAQIRALICLSFYNAFKHVIEHLDKLTQALVGEAHAKGMEESAGNVDTSTLGCQALGELPILNRQAPRSALQSISRQVAFDFRQTAPGISPFQDRSNSASHLNGYNRAL
jgi:hypothetical protein